MTIPETRPIHRLLAVPGAAESLTCLAAGSETAFHRHSLDDLFSDQGAVDASNLVDQFLAANLLQPYGDRLGISAYGIRTELLLEALNGGDLDDVVRRLQRVTGQVESYQLVREDMTRQFFESLVDHPTFGRLYVCSPWVNPTTRQASQLKHAMLQAERRFGSPAEVLVLTRPSGSSGNELSAGLQPFVDIGARFFFNPKLHSKVYIREPGPSGGYSLAIVGSQNLTRSSHLELGIRINGDTRLINQLIQYFWHVTNFSQERN